MSVGTPETGQSVLTVADLLGLDEFRSAEVTVAAGGHRLGNRVEWVHVFETPAVSEVLRGGEFLLTTGIGLAGMSPAQIEALVAAVARSGAAGIGFEPTHAAADVLVPACRAHELPLIVFGRDVRFVDITHVVHERLVSGELQTLRRAVTLQAQLRDAAREGLGPGGLVAALGGVLGAQVLFERIDRTRIATSPEDGLDVAFLDALDRQRQRLPTALQSRPVNPGCWLHVLSRHGDELDELALDEAAFLLSVALAAQPPPDEVPAAERARLLQRLAEGLGALGAVAGSVLAGERVEPRFGEADQGLLEALVATGWSKAAAARRLRLSRQRLYERLGALNERHGIDVDLPQTRVELALEVWAVRMAELLD